MKKFRMYSGLKLCSKLFCNLCKHNDIIRHEQWLRLLNITTYHKSLNKTIMERVGCMILCVRVPQVFQAKNIVNISYLMDIFPSTTLNMKTFWEIQSCHSLYLKILKIFGYITYAYIRQKNQNQWLLNACFYIL